jgi:hypothetical protein
MRGVRRLNPQRHGSRRQNFEETDAPLIQRVEQDPGRATSRCHVHHRIWVEAPVGPIRISGENDLARTRDNRHHAAGATLSFRHADSRRKRQLHVIHAGCRGCRGQSLDRGPLVAGSIRAWRTVRSDFAKRDTDRPHTGDRGHDLAQPRLAHRTEGALSGILGVDHVSAALDRRLRVGSVSHTHQQSHRLLTYLFPSRWHCVANSLDSTIAAATSDGRPDALPWGRRLE